LSGSARAQTLRVASLALGLLAPVCAWAATGEHAEEGHGGGGSMIWHALNLLILIAAIVYFGRKPIQEFFATRRREIEANLERSAGLLREAEHKLGEWNRRMAQVDGEATEIHRLARERAESERRAILAEAEAAAERIRRDATAAVEQETRRARERLRHEASSLAVDLAADLVRRQIQDGDRARLADEFIGKVEQAGAKPAGRA
jgi:F-type H+-transporting ATPase subunit b